MYSFQIHKNFVIGSIIALECDGSFSPFWIKYTADLKNNDWKSLHWPSDPLS